MDLKKNYNTESCGYWKLTRPKKFRPKEAGCRNKDSGRS